MSDQFDQFDPQRFRETMGHYPTGVAVVTAMTEDGPDGMVVGTFSSVSLEPPLIAFFPMASSRSFARLRTASSFCVNVLAADQEALCRRLATSGASKFDDVPWHPAPLGSPILEGAVSFIECTFESVETAGDHFIVLGRVTAHAIERPTLPLLFFQGGYGRFSASSLIAAPEPDLIHAAQHAESIRPRIEALSADLGVTCGVLAKIGWNAVQVLAVNHAAVDERFPLGHRQPIVPPLGAVFLVHAADDDVEHWLSLAPDRSEERRERNRTLLGTVRERGYSVLAADPAAMDRHRTALDAFTAGEGLPRAERAVRQATSDLGALYCPDLVPGARMDIESIVLLLPTAAGLPPMALRVTGLAGGLATEQVEAVVEQMRFAGGAPSEALDEAFSEAR